MKYQEYKIIIYLWTIILQQIMMCYCGLIKYILIALKFKFNLVVWRLPWQASNLQSPLEDISSWFRTSLIQQTCWTRLACQALSPTRLHCTSLQTYNPQLKSMPRLVGTFQLIGLPNLTQWKRWTLFSNHFEWISPFLWATLIWPTLILIKIKLEWRIYQPWD